MKEIEHGSFSERTLQNVKDSDGTVIIFRGEPRGGTKQTREFCENKKRPYQLIDADEMSIDEASELISKFVRENGIRILNVAGPRASEWPKGYDYALKVIYRFLSDSPGVIRERTRGTSRTPFVISRDPSLTLRMTATLLERNAFTGSSRAARYAGISAANEQMMKALMQIFTTSHRNHFCGNGGELVDFARKNFDMQRGQAND